jgi:imidazoleglycerol-phosphate dehydratase
VRPPGSISSLSNALAIRGLSEPDAMRSEVAATIAERERLHAGLAPLGWRVPHSETNALFCDLGEPAQPWIERLLAAGIVVRTFDALPDCIRITVGAPDENDRVLAALGVPATTAAAPLSARTGVVRRATRETTIDATWSLDGTGRAAVTTGIGFLDHMLAALAFHSLTDLRLTCTGDLWVDEHHTTEDVAIALGRALDQALGDRAGIRRFGDARAPLDEAICHATVDLGGRGFSVVELPLRGERVGGLPSSLVPHMIDSLSRAGRLGIHLQGQGDDDHHVVESAFKALALALRQAIAPDPGRAGDLPSTKGTI